MRERLGRDSENLSSLEIPVFIRGLRDLLRDFNLQTPTAVQVCLIGLISPLDADE